MFSNNDIVSINEIPINPPAKRDGEQSGGGKVELLHEGTRYAVADGAHCAVILTEVCA
jgi:hypothetical protein